MEGERKKREAQDKIEKAKIKKELAQKAAEVSEPVLVQTKSFRHCSSLMVSVVKIWCTFVCND